MAQFVRKIQTMVLMHFVIIEVVCLQIMFVFALKLNSKFVRVIVSKFQSIANIHLRQTANWASFSSSPLLLFYPVSHLHKFVHKVV